MGETFADRVAASLLSAVGLPELVTSSDEDYEATAIALAGDPDRLTALRAKLARHRESAPLFDTGLFARHLETAFDLMHARLEAGLPPDHIDVPDLRGGSAC